MDQLAAARKHFAVVRARRRNLRLNLYQGRNGGGSYNGRLTLAGEAARTCGRRLEGLLWAEHRLAERISENRDLGNPRPELRARMTALRRRIKAVTTTEEHT